jgi:xanthine/uracil permease
MRTQTIPFRSFMAKDYDSESVVKTLAKVITATGPALIVIVPKGVLAAGVDSTFGNIHSSVMNIFDSGVVLVIIFAGAAWGLGHRTKAIEILIGVCCGYILARHAVDIRDFLKSI